MMSHLAQAFEYDVGIRVENDRAPRDGAVIIAEDIEEGLVYEGGGVSITAFEVDHAPVTPAFGYRVDYDGRSVVLSGDTRVSENLIRYAEGVDVLIHEVFVPETLRRAGVPPERAANIVAYHATPAEVGEVFRRTSPRMAVYSHICMPGATDDDLLPPTRSAYAGPLEIGEDLMAIDVGATITVRRRRPPSP
jgi:ribonuclease Z